MLANIDYLIFQKINGLAGKSGFFDWLGVFFAEYLAYILVLIAVAWVLWELFKMKSAPKVMKSFLGAIASSLILSRLIITEAIRYFFYRPRPFLSHQVNAILDHSSSASFPSGHMALFFALSAIIYHFNRKLGRLFFVSSTIMGIARIFCGVHYPLDIIGGAIIGILSVWLVNKIVWKNI